MRDLVAPISWPSTEGSFSAFELRAEATIRNEIADGFERRAAESPAYWHPNGFAVFPLGQFGTDLLRLHVWPAIQSLRYEWHPEIHSHDRHVASVLLGGYKTDHRWQQTPGCEYEVYFVEDLNDSTRLVTSGQIIGLREKDVRRYEPGEFYVEAAGKLHSISKPDGVPCATLCLKSEIVARSYQRVVGAQSLNNFNTHRTPLTCKEKSGLLAEVSLRT